MSSRPDRPATRLVRGALAGMLILAAGAAGYHRLHPAPAACASPVTVNILSSTEKADALGTLARRYNALPHRPGCGEIAVQRLSSGIAEELLADIAHVDSDISEADRTTVRAAHVWAPSSVIWLEQLDLDKKSDYHRRPLRSLGSSPLVLAMPGPTAQRLGWPGRAPTWRQAMDALIRGDLHYTQENPRTSTSGALATFLTYAAAAAGGNRLAPATLAEDDLPSLNDYVRKVQAATRSGFFNDSVEILRSWHEKESIPADTMIMVQEQMVHGFNDGMYPPHGDDRPAGWKPEVPLVAVHPVATTGGAESIVAEHPYVTLDTATAEEKAIAGAFFTFVMDDWSVLCDAGFRSPVGDDTVGCASPRPGETDVAALALPDSAVRSEMARQWNDLRSKRRITIAMDVSGSMRDDRLRQATAAVIDGVTRMRPTDQVEIFQFAGTTTFQSPYWQIRPLGDVGTDFAGEAEADNLGATPGNPAIMEKSSVYMTITKLYAAVAERQRAGGSDTLDVLIVLSDGVDDWKRNGTTPDTVCDRFADSPVAVPVHTIHYDPGMYTPEEQKAGVRALQRFATCSGVPGLAQDSTDNASMRKIFSQVLGSV